MKKCQLAKKLSVFQGVSKIIHHIKVHALNLCFFIQFYEEVETEHKRLLLYT